MAVHAGAATDAVLAGLALPLATCVRHGSRRNPGESSGSAGFPGFPGADTSNRSDAVARGRAAGLPRTASRVVRASGNAPRIS